VPHAGDPLFRPEPPSDGRWQRGETVGGVYFADSEETTWAEWYRSLAELAIPPDRQMPRDLWRWSIEVEGVADLSGPEQLAAVGLSLPKPLRREWPAFQKVGEGLANAGHAGVLAPSAARPASLVLCLFRAAAKLYGAEPIPPALTYRRPPAPPTGLLT